jgi:hypothetical protein
MGISVTCILHVSLTIQPCLMGNHYQSASHLSLLQYIYDLEHCVGQPTMRATARHKVQGLSLQEHCAMSRNGNLLDCSMRRRKDKKPVHVHGQR